MRTPNTECLICKKPLYRRKHELEKVRFVACMDHRAEGQKMYGQTEKQKEALKLGRTKGDNRLTGIPKSKESNRKRSESHKKWCRENPDKVQDRSSKVRGEKHYRWNGGISKLNLSIRQMTENRKWMDAVKARDKKCIFCGSVDELESDHIKPLAQILEEHQIKSRDGARECNELWDIKNGRTLCRKCHYKKDNRKYSKYGHGRRKAVRKNATGNKKSV